jgi:hypothetical protein
MVTRAPKHPLTHCERYGHTWVASISAGFDVCAYVGGKGRTKRPGAYRRPGYALLNVFLSRLRLLQKRTW